MDGGRRGGRRADRCKCEGMHQGPKQGSGGRVQEGQVVEGVVAKFALVSSKDLSTF